MIPVPHGSVASGSVVFEAVDDHLDGGGGIGHEYEVELFRVCVKEAQRAIADFVDAVTRDCGWCRRGVRIAVEIGDEVGRELFHQGFGVQLGSMLVV